MDDLASAVAAASQAIREVGGFTLQQRCVLGTFAFASLALVEDLKASDDLLESSLLAKALAGDVDAQMQLKARAGEKVAETELDQIPASAEALILDSDPSQAQAVHTILRFGSASAVIDGPPGTGKSQTIANAISALIAEGKSVLFVAEKRAALDVVQRRLSAAGLGSLILDMRRRHACARVPTAARGREPHRTHAPARRSPNGTKLRRPAQNPQRARGTDEPAPAGLQLVALRPHGPPRQIQRKRRS